MGRLCKGYCEDYTCQKIPNGQKYQHCKRCTYCGVFLKTVEVRCPCCGAILRTKPRTRKPSLKEPDKVKPEYKKV